MTDELRIPDTCGFCPYYDPIPPNPKNLGAPKVGECLALPPVPLAQARGTLFCGPRVTADRKACSYPKMLQLLTNIYAIVSAPAESYPTEIAPQQAQAIKTSKDE